MRKLIVPQKYNNKKLNTFILASFPELSINMLNKALNEKYTVSQLKKMGFCASSKNKEEAKGKPTNRVWMPVKVGLTR